MVKLLKTQMADGSYNRTIIDTSEIVRVDIAEDKDKNSKTMHMFIFYGDKINPNSVYIPIVDNNEDENIVMLWLNSAEVHKLTINKDLSLELE